MIENLISSPWVFLKIGIVAILFMYLIFSLIVVRQVKLMTDTLKVGYDNFLKSLSYVHLIFTVLVLLAALVIL